MVKQRTVGSLETKQIVSEYLFTILDNIQTERCGDVEGDAEVPFDAGDETRDHFEHLEKVHSVHHVRSLGCCLRIGVELLVKSARVGDLVIGDKDGVLLGVTTTPDMHISRPLSKVRDEIEEGRRDKRRVLSNCSIISVVR